MQTRYDNWKDSDDSLREGFTKGLCLLDLPSACAFPSALGDSLLLIGCLAAACELVMSSFWRREVRTASCSPAWPVRGSMFLVAATTLVHAALNLHCVTTRVMVLQSGEAAPGVRA
jgi:hypothetical protein